MFRLRCLISLTLVLLFARHVHAQGFVPAREWHKAGPAKEFKPVKGGQAARHDANGRVGQCWENPTRVFHQFDWDRKSDEIRLAVYVNAGDSYGVCISNLKKGDIIQVTSARGDCRFSRGDAAKQIASFLVVASTAATTAIEPELAPTVEKATQFAKDYLVPSGRGIMRDPFGYDSGTGDYCGDEGGILICLPGRWHLPYAKWWAGKRSPKGSTDRQQPPAAHWEQRLLPGSRCKGWIGPIP